MSFLSKVFFSPANLKSNRLRQTDQKKSLMVVKNRPEGEIISAHWFCWWYWWGLRLGQHSLMVLVSFVLQKLFYFHYLCLKIPFGPNEGWQFPHCHTCFCIIKYPSEGWRNTNTTPRDGKQIPTDQQSDKNQMFIEKGNSKWTKTPWTMGDHVRDTMRQAFTWLTKL